MAGPEARWTPADSAELRTLLAGCRDDLAAIQADMDAIKARLGRTPTLMSWMALATAYVAFLLAALGLLS